MGVVDEEKMFFVVVADKHVGRVDGRVWVGHGDGSCEKALWERRACVGGLGRGHGVDAWGL